VQGVVRFFQHISDGSFRTRCLHFTHEAAADPAYYEEVLGCPVLFGQSQNRIYFNPIVLEYRSLHAEPELLKLHERFASDQIAALEKQDLVGQVRRVIAEVLDAGEANLETVAERLEMKPRMLRSRVADAGTTFNEILADYRCHLAKKLLAKSEESIDEIVYLTGFSEPSTFYRAFKRWTGVTPIEYRNQNRDGAPEQAAAGSGES